MAGLVTSWLRAVFGYQILTQDGNAVPQQVVLELPAGTLQDDALNKRTIYNPFGAGISPTFGTVSASSLTLGGGIVQQTTAQATYSDSSVHTLWSLPLVAGQVVTLWYDVAAQLAPAGPHAAFSISFWSRRARLYLPTGGAATIGANIECADGSDAGNPFALGSPPYDTAAAGAIALSTSGSTASLTVQGFPTPGAWAGSHAYNVGDLVVNGSNVYLCTDGGTSASSGGPTGTGGSISDGGAKWAYIGPSSAGVPIRWTAWLRWLVG